jgi:tetratricopeptide (TPR) repeat protein
MTVFFQKLTQLLLIIMLLATISHAQVNIDSLTQLSQSTQSDSVKTKAFLDICWALKASQPKQALEYGEKALELSRLKNFPDYEAMALKNIATVHLFQGKYEKAENYYLAAIKIFDKIGNKKGESSCYNNIGILLGRKGEFEQAMDYYEKSLKIDEEIENKNGVATTLENIGNVLQKQGNYKKSIEYYINAQKIKEELNDKLGIASTYNNIAGLYEKQEALDEAIKNYQNALVLYIEINEKRKSSMVLHNIGYALSRKNQYNDALEYYNQALSIREDYGDKAGLASTLLNIAEVYQSQKKYEKALNSLTKSEAIYREIGNKYGIMQVKIALGGYFRDIKNYQKAINIIEPLLKEKNVIADYKVEAFKVLSESYGNLQNYGKAFAWQKKYIQLKDSLENKENTRKILEIQLGYEFDKKQKELELEQEKQRLRNIAELNKRRLINWVLITCLLAITLIGILIYRSYTLKKKDNQLLSLQKRKIEETNEELVTYQEELISQKEHLEVQQEIVTAQRDKITEQKQKITDSIQYAKRIQDSILPPDDLFQNAFEDHFVIFRPKDIVSGDFYWLKETNDHIFVAAGDCTGHGVPGAFMSLLGVSFLNEVIESGSIDSAEILDKTRDRLKTTLRQHLKSNEPRDGIDIGLCAINKKNKQLQFSGAYNSLIVIKNSNNENAELTEFKGDKMPIGAHYKADKEFSAQNIKIEKNDKFFLYTDGFIDQFGGAYNRKFLPYRFKELILSSLNGDMLKQKEAMLNGLENWMDNKEQIDDILVVGFSL